MKNRRTANKEILLLYRFRDTEIGRQLLGVAARMGILCKVVEEEQTNEMLGTLLKLPGYGTIKSECKQDINEAGVESMSEAASCEGSNKAGCESDQSKALSRQMMVMYGFTGQRLDEFLQNMRKAGLPKIPLKAIVTPHNVNWTFRQLYEELEQEEAAYQNQRR